MKKTTTTLKNFASKHKTALAVTVAVVATATATYAISIGIRNGWNGYLEEKGLYEDFYNLTE